MVLRKVVIKIRNLIFDLNDRNSIFGKTLTIGWNFFHNIKVKYKFHFIELKRRRYFPDEELFQKNLRVNPQKILFFVDQEKLEINKFSFINQKSFNKIKKQINNLPELQLLTEKVHEKRDWHEIWYYNEILNKIENRKKYDLLVDRQEFDNILNFFEVLLHKKSKVNYQFNDILYELEKYKNDISLDILNEITIAIDEYGHLILLNGRLGFALLKFLNIPKIPLKVLTRHKNWVDIKKELINFSLNYRDKKLYQPLTHPDLQFIPSKYGDLRFNIIKKNLSCSKGNLLDIGANLGYFCQKFEDLGFNCSAVEYNKFYTDLMKKLKKAENKQFKIIEGSIFNYKKNQELRFDVVIALNIFHHFLRRKNVFENFIVLLNRLKVKELFFETHNPKEFINQKVYKNFTPEQFIDFIIQNSCLTNAELLYEFENGRRIYKLVANKK